MEIKNKSKKSPKNWGFDIKNLDTKIRPQDDFFQYANGGWIKNNPIPPTKARWGSFYTLRENGLIKIKSLVEKISKIQSPKKGSEEQLIRDFYKSGTNVKFRNSLGTKPIDKFLSEIDDLKNTDDLISFIFKMHKMGFSLIWGTHVGQDDKKSDAYAIVFTQDGLALPDRDFYLKTDERSKTIRTAYLKHIENMFSLIKDKNAKENGKTILDLETKLARFSMNNVDARDIEKVYNKKTFTQLKNIAPTIPWTRFFKEMNLNPKYVIAYQPDFLKKATLLLKSVPLKTWKTYLHWNILADSGPFLSDAFAKEQFEFFGKVLMGRQEMEPVWKRVLGGMEMGIGDAIGKEYVKKYFPEEAKKKMDEMIDNLFSAYHTRIENLDWMSAKTKTKALLKLKAIARKIGYPDKWKSYKGLVIKSDDYYGNALRSMEHERKKELKRFGKKVDRSEWFMTAQTVNAYYSQNMNDIAFPAGILQPPFFDFKADMGINYGAIGSIIGHEFTHGFDDQGSKYDGVGNFNNWWSKDDLKKFNAKAKIIVDQFNKFKVGDLNVNGKLTLGENIADLGGAVIAYYAYKKYLEKHGREDIAGFTPEQRYFLGLALVECGHERPESARTMIMVDPHAPPPTRINGPTANMIEFYEAFDVKKGDKLYRDPKLQARIW